MPYFEVLDVDFVKGPCDANLAFCLCLSNAKMKTRERNEEGLLICL